VAHTESPAGLVGLMAAATNNMRDAFLPGIPHLRACNPHVCAVLDATSSAAAARMTSCGRQLASSAALQLPGALTGTSAFAFQGTNAHALVADAGGACNGGFDAIYTSTDVSASIVVPSLWAVGVKARHWLTLQPHQLLRRAVVNGAGGAALFHVALGRGDGASPMSASLWDHRVSGRGILPGAAFLELAHSALCLAYMRGGAGDANGAGDGDETVAVLGASIAAPLQLTEGGGGESGGDDYCGAEVRVMLAAGRLEISAAASAAQSAGCYGGGRRCMTASVGRLVTAPPPPRHSGGEYSRRQTLITACNVHGNEEASMRTGVVGDGGGVNCESTIAASIGQSAASRDVGALRTSPAALDASFQSVSATWHRAEQILRVPAAFNAFVGQSSSVTSSSTLLSRNAVRESATTGAAQSQHVLGGAIVRGMTAKSMRRAAADVVATSSRESKMHKESRYQTRTNGVNTDRHINDAGVSAVVVQHQATPPPPPAMRCDATDGGIRYGNKISDHHHRRSSSLAGGSAVAMVARSLACVYAGATCDATSGGMHLTVVTSAAAVAAGGSEEVDDSMGLLGAARAAALELGDGNHVTSERRTIRNTQSSCIATTSDIDGGDDNRCHHAQQPLQPRDPSYRDASGGRGGVISLPRAVALAIDSPPKPVDSSDEALPVTAALRSLLLATRDSVDVVNPGSDTVSRRRRGGGGGRGGDGAGVGGVVNPGSDTVSRRLLLLGDAAKEDLAPPPVSSLLSGKLLLVAGGTGALGTAIAIHATQRWGCPTTLLSRSGRSANVAELVGANTPTLLRVVAADTASMSDQPVGLYKSNPADPRLESAWIQTLRL
jgi:hypothetical protein